MIEVMRNLPMHPVWVRITDTLSATDGDAVTRNSLRYYSINQEIKDWLVDSKIPLDDEQQFMFRVIEPDLLFLFKDPKLATYFKLKWGNSVG